MTIKKYKTIYADCPWEYDDKKGNLASMGAATSAYPVMTLDEIKALPVSNVADKDCTLLLWATMPKMEEAFEVIKAWGFKYKTCAFDWVKLNPTGRVVISGKDIILVGGVYSGLGHWVNGNAELVLLANRGHPKRLVKNVKQILFSPRGKHSVKPEEARRRIELFLEPPYLELFARRKVPNWDVWGNEVESDIEL